MKNKAREQHQRMVRAQLKAIRRKRRDRTYSAIGTLAAQGVLSPEDVDYILPRTW